jgi:restriction system protein
MLDSFLNVLLTPTFIAIFAVLGVAAVVGLIARSPSFKGWSGELLVKLIAKLHLNSGDYAAVHNVTLPTEDGGSTQIDHVIVSRFGVFVVETKNMRGRIFGQEHDRQWTQKLGRKSFKFQNPLRQNYKHTETLADCLGIPRSIVHSVIVFVGESKFGKEMPPNVTYCSGYARHIKRSRDPVLTPEEMKQALDLVGQNRLEPSRKTHREHVRHVKALKQARSPKAQEAISANPTTSPVCPACGSAMVLRTANKGKRAGSQFWGCSRFPQCRKTRPA